MAAEAEEEEEQKSRNFFLFLQKGKHEYIAIVSELLIWWAHFFRVWTHRHIDGKFFHYSAEPDTIVLKWNS